MSYADMLDSLRGLQAGGLQSERGRMVMDFMVDVCREALEKYGAESQTLMLFEEMSELIRSFANTPEARTTCGS